MPVINFNKDIQPNKIQQVIRSKDDVLTVGKKYKGYTVQQVHELRPEYLAWLLRQQMIIIEDYEVRDMVDLTTMECVEDKKWPYYESHYTQYVDWDDMENEAWGYLQEEYCGGGHN